MKNVKINLRQTITPLSNTQLTRNYNALREDLDTLANDVNRIDNTINNDITDKFEDIYERFNALINIIAGYHSEENTEDLEGLKFFTRKQRQQELIDTINGNYNNLIEFFNTYYDTTTFDVFLLNDATSSNNDPINNQSGVRGVVQQEEKTIEEQIESILTSFNSLIDKLQTIASNNDLELDTLVIDITEETNDEKLDLIVSKLNALIILVIENFDNLSEEMINELNSYIILTGDTTTINIHRPSAPQITLNEIEEQLENDNIEILQNENGQDVVVETPEVIETMGGDNDDLMQTKNDEIIITNN